MAVHRFRIETRVTAPEGSGGAHTTYAGEGVNEKCIGDALFPPASASALSHRVRGAPLYPVSPTTAHRREGVPPVLG